MNFLADEGVDRQIVDRLRASAEGELRGLAVGADAGVVGVVLMRARSVLREFLHESN